MTVLDRYKRNNELDKKREEFKAIGYTMCEKCSGTGIKSHFFKSIEECEHCDGEGGFKRTSIGGVGDNFGILSDGYGFKTLRDLHIKPKYRYNWKTGKAELVRLG